MRITIGKTTFKTRHFKKAALIAVYMLVVVIMIVGQASTAFTSGN